MRKTTLFELRGNRNPAIPSGLLGLIGLFGLLWLAAGCGGGSTCSDTSPCGPSDGCCPAGCFATDDADCSLFCGNDQIDAGETCDGNCPTDCDDRQACTRDRLVGSAAACSAACSYEPITACVDGDGCCPGGCDAESDDDCSASCGNGSIEAGETCDPPGSCPQSDADCDDGDACTADALLGAAASCSASCSHQAITLCAAGDGCCPAGCDGATDPDCAPVCGNGVLEADETCDPPGSCPQSDADCDDGDACTTGRLAGSPADCSAHCVQQPLDACLDGDGCCGLGCNALNDGDCEPVCGNAVVEPGETCDPPESCPRSSADCDDGDACTVDHAFANADDCSSYCRHDPIQACLSGDGCCPAGCGHIDDTDCAPCPEGQHACPGGCCEFDVEIVESRYSIYSDHTALVLDELDRPRLIYTHSTAPLRMARWNPFGWEFQDTYFGHPVQGVHHVLVNDPAGGMHAAMYDRISRQLLYGRYQDGSWTFETIQQVDPMAGERWLDMALGRDGQPMVIYFDPQARRVMLAVRGQSWTLWSVVAREEVRNPCLAFDGEHVHAAWVEPDQQQIVYAERRSQHWQVRRVAGDPRGSGLELALDHQQRPHLLWAATAAEQVIHAWSVDNVWRTEVAAEGLAARDLAFTADGSGRLHALATSQALIYLRQNAGSWSQLVMWPWLDQGQHASLAIDSQGRPVAACTQTDPDDLLLIRW